MPNFGKFRDEKQKIIRDTLSKVDLLETTTIEFAKRPANEATKHFTIQDVIGNGLDKIGAYNELDNKQQKVALIDDVSLIFKA